MKKLTTLFVIGALLSIGLSSCAARCGFSGPKLTIDGLNFEAEGRMGPQSMLESK